MPEKLGGYGRNDWVGFTGISKIKSNIGKKNVSEILASSDGNIRLLVLKYT